ncbi:MAG: thioredoxin [archaeon]
MAIIHADDTNFDAELSKATGLVVIDFFADWCGPCQMFGPTFEETSNEYSDVAFLKVDTEQAPNTAQKFAVMSIPTIVFMKKGKILEVMRGALPKETLKSKIEELKA